MAQYLLIMQQEQRGGCSQFSDYIHMRCCNPILNLLCTANVVPPISLVDEESFCHHAVSVVIKSCKKKKMNLSDLYCNGQLLSQFFQVTDRWRCSALVLFCWRFRVCVCVAESMSELFLSEASGSNSHRKRFPVYSFLSRPLDALAQTSGWSCHYTLLFVLRLSAPTNDLTTCQSVIYSQKNAAGPAVWICSRKKI